MTVGLGRTTDGTALERARALTPIFAAGAAAHDRDGSFPFENFSRLAEAGLLALRTPKLHGGCGAGIGEAAKVVGAIAEGEPATALVLAMQYILHAGLARNAHWPPSLKARLGREASNGVSLINALRVEPELGSPARGGVPATTASRIDGEWRISGHKIYSTGVPILCWYAVWAKTDDTPIRVGVFLVPARLPGIKIVETWDHLGLRASGSHDVIFDNVAIPLDHAVDVRLVDEWTPEDLQQQHTENGLLLAALYNGVATSARNWLVGFLQDRVPANLGKPLASLPRVQETVGAMEVLLRTNARLIDGLGSNIDAGVAVDPTDAHVVKSVVTNNAVEIVQMALSLTGNHGLTRSNPLERHYRDALCGRVHTPQDDSVRLSLGRAAVARSPATRS